MTLELVKEHLKALNTPMAKRDHDNFSFLQAVLTGKTKGLKWIDKKNYRWWFISGKFPRASLPKDVEVAAHTAINKSPKRWQNVDAATDFLVAVGLELSTANDDLLIDFLLRVSEYPVFKNKLPSTVVGVTRIRVLPLSRIYFWCHFILVSTDYGRLTPKKEPRLVRLAPKFEFILENLVDLWSSLCSSTSNNLEIILEVSWVCLISNRYLGKTLMMPEGFQYLVKETKKIVNGLLEFYPDSLNLGASESLRSFGHSLLLAAFCEKELETCKVPVCVCLTILYHEVLPLLSRMSVVVEHLMLF